MDPLQIGYSVALGIGGTIVAWCAAMIVIILQRISVLETRLADHVAKCERMEAYNHNHNHAGE